MKKYSIIFLLIVDALLLSCSSSRFRTEVTSISKIQYEKDKLQISNYILNNIEFYRSNPELCDSVYRDYANFFNPYAHFYDKNKESFVIATIPASHYMKITVDTIVYDLNGLKCFIFCGFETKTIMSNHLISSEKGRNFDSKDFVGIRNNNTDSLSIYPFVKYSIFGYENLIEAVKDLEFLYYNKLKGETLSASHYANNGFKQNVGDKDFFDNSVIFQQFDDSTFNYQYCYFDLIKYPYMK